MRMTKWLVVFLVFSIGRVQAMDGVFDRSAEVSRYIEQINQTQSQAEMIDVVKPIYISGIGDEKLAEALGERLLKDLPAVDSSRESSQYAAWMVKALSSTGTEYARRVIGEVRNKTRVSRVVKACDDTLPKIDWERRKGEIMSSRKNYNEGDKMEVVQLLNLLQDSDFTYKQNAAYRMSWDKVLDPRLMVEIAKQLQIFVDKNGMSDDKAEIVAMSHYAKMLGYSGNAEYRPLLVSLYNSKADLIVKRQASAAEKRL